MGHLDRIEERELLAKDNAIRKAHAELRRIGHIDSREITIPSTTGSTILGAVTLHYVRFVKNARGQWEFNKYWSVTG